MKLSKMLIKSEKHHPEGIETCHFEKDYSSAVVLYFVLPYNIAKLLLKMSYSLNCFEGNGLLGMLRSNC